MDDIKLDKIVLEYIEDFIVPKAAYAIIINEVFRGYKYDDSRICFANETAYWIDKFNKKADIS